MQEEKGHVVKVFFSGPLHHAMRVLLVSRRQTWEEWAISMAERTIEEATRMRDTSARIRENPTR